MIVGIRDGNFMPSCQPSMSLGGDNAHEHARAFDWSASLPPRFYTDMELVHGPYDSHPRVAWCIEPPPFRPDAYAFLQEHEDTFDYILTSCRDLIATHDPAKWLFWPGGGSYIAPDLWCDQPKTGLVSLLSSDKRMATGHHLRHAIYDRFKDRLAVYGTIAGGSYVRSYDALAPYKYSIICETERLDWRFSEKLIDCLAVGTIPIYWGCPEIDHFFDPAGIIPFTNIDNLPTILAGLYDRPINRNAIERNRHWARQYRCAEDWIFAHYPFLFEGLTA